MSTSVEEGPWDPSPCMGRTGHLTAPPFLSSCHRTQLPDVSSREATHPGEQTEKSPQEIQASGL